MQRHVLECSPSSSTFQKPSGGVPAGPALASSDPGPLSVPIVNPGIQIEHIQPPSAPPSNVGLTEPPINASLTSIPSSSSQTTHNPYILTAQIGGWPSYPIVNYPSLSAPTFPSANSLQTFPTVASTLARNPGENVFTNTAPQNTQPTEGGSQSLATNDPSPRPLSETPGSSAESDADGSTPTKSKRIRISRRNPAHGYVEGAMMGTKEYSESFIKSQVTLDFEAALVYSCCSAQGAAGPANGCSVGKQTVQTTDR